MSSTQATTRQSGDLHASPVSCSGKRFRRCLDRQKILGKRHTPSQTLIQGLQCAKQVFVALNDFVGEYRGGDSEALRNMRISEAYSALKGQYAPDSARGETDRHRQRVHWQDELTVNRTHPTRSRGGRTGESTQFSSSPQNCCRCVSAPASHSTRWSSRR